MGLSTITSPFLQVKKLRYRFSNVLRVVHLLFGQATVWSSGACLECVSSSPPLFTAAYLSQLRAVHFDTFYSIVYFFFFHIWKFPILLYFTCCVSFCCSKVIQLCVYIYPLVFGFPSSLSHHRALSRVPWTMQHALISDLFIYSITSVHM